MIFLKANSGSWLDGGDVASFLFIAVVMIIFYEYKKKKDAKKQNINATPSNNILQNQKPEVDVFSEIKKLKSLLDDGVLSQEEYEKMKSNLLNKK